VNSSHGIQSLVLRGRRLLQNWLLPGFDYIAHRCMYRGDFIPASVAFRIIIEIKPKHSCASSHLADIYSSLGRTSAAIEVLERQLSNCPENLNARLNLVLMLTLEGRTTDARYEVERILRIAPRNPDVLTACGMFYRGLGDLSESSGFLKSSLAERESVEALCLLAENLRDDNSAEEAVLLLERAIALDPNRSQAYYLLAKSKYYKEMGHVHMENIKRLSIAPNIDVIERASVNFTLGIVCDQLGLWDQAFAYFDAGNELRRRNTIVNIKQVNDDIDDRIRTFKKECFSNSAGIGSAKVGKSLVFIVGMPRSGSTLVEQILGSHPSVYVGGERADMARLLIQLQSELDGPYPASIRQLQPEVASRLAIEHLASVTKLLDGHDRFVDKGLANFFELGMIMMLFPGAQIIHCCRNALDTCLSCFANNLVQIDYSCDLKALALIYQGYERMMSHWHSVLPGRILDVRYQDVVRAPECEIRKLLTFCDLSWDPACLTHHRTRRAILTASASQVKLPTYGTSVGRWKQYEAHLGELIRVLGPERMKE
jgi:tetratricopeptide (TPR) repeat protein